METRPGRSAAMLPVFFRFIGNGKFYFFDRICLQHRLLGDAQVHAAGRFLATRRPFRCIISPGRDDRCCPRREVAGGRYLHGVIYVPLSFDLEARAVCLGDCGVCRLSNSSAGSWRRRRWWWRWAHGGRWRRIQRIQRRIELQRPQLHGRRFRIRQWRRFQRRIEL